MSFPQEPSWPKKVSADKPVQSSFDLSAPASPGLREDPESPARAKAEPAVLSVEQLNKEIRTQLEGRFDLVWVKGEISNFKPHSSGHYYFSLKDSKAQIKAVMFRGYNSRLKFRPHDGLEVLVRGRITVYEPRGDYQITAELMEPVGAGALQKAFEQLKTKLHQEGLFDPKKKRPLPEFPRGIAIVTSPTGAAIRDMLNILSRRNRGIPVTIIPTIVQGAAAAPKIIEALRQAYKLPNVDVIIFGRGGGSIEDMWAFNDETLARTVAESPVPIVSAVGHEIDFTIGDFVADLRAPTPSAAAELVVKNVADLAQNLTRHSRMLGLASHKLIQFHRSRVERLRARLVDPKTRIENLQQRNDNLFDRLTAAIKLRVERHETKRKLLRGRLVSPEQVLRSLEKSLMYQKSRLVKSMDVLLKERSARTAKWMSNLDSLSPLRTIDRGYSIVYSPEGQVVRSVDQVQVGTALITRVADGWLTSELKTKKNETEKRELSHGL